MLGLRFCARAFSICGKWGPFFIAVRGPLIIAASLVEEHRLQTRRLSNCGSRAQLLRGMWDLPRPGIEPVSPALAGRFLTTAPPGKPQHSYLSIFDWIIFVSLYFPLGPFFPPLYWLGIFAFYFYSSTDYTQNLLSTLNKVQIVQYFLKINFEGMKYNIWKSVKTKSTI